MLSRVFSVKFQGCTMIHLNITPLSQEKKKLKVIGCSSLRGGGGELVTLKTLTYGFLRYVAKVVIIRK